MENVSASIFLKTKPTEFVPRRAGEGLWIFPRRVENGFSLKNCREAAQSLKRSIETEFFPHRAGVFFHQINCTCASCRKSYQFFFVQPHSIGYGTPVRCSVRALKFLSQLALKPSKLEKHVFDDNTCFVQPHSIVYTL